MKKLISATLAASLALSLAACGSSASTDSVAASSEAASTESTAASTRGCQSTAETGELAGTTLKVAASPTPHAEILNVAKEILAEQGIDLEVVEFSDYVQPNQVADGALDANYFQHTPYLDSFNAKNGTNLVIVGTIHYEPFGIYPARSTDLKDLAKGATIIIPADDSNETRALFLLQQEGLIKLPDDADAAKGVSYARHRRRRRLQHVQFRPTPSRLSSEQPTAGSIAVINGNYAMEAGLKVGDALATEDANGAAAQTYANVLVVKEGRENYPAIQALYAALTSDKVKDYINSTYDGAVVPIF